MFDRVEEAAARLQVLSGRLPETAIVLGSGLGDFADTLRDPVAFPYIELPHWPASNVVGHAGRLVIGNVAGKRVGALAGRVSSGVHPEAGAAAPATAGPAAGLAE